MAKVKFTALIDDHTFVGDLFTNIFNFDLVSDAPKRAVYQDAENGTKMVLRGSGFEYDLDNDTITAGTITRIVFADEDNKRYLTVSKGEWSPEDLLDAYFSDGFEGITAYVLGGKDRMIGGDSADLLQGEGRKDVITGGKGADWIWGDAGNDRLTGDKGSDSFYFYPGDGKDVITDFDAVGGGKKQDYLGIEPMHTFEEKHTKAGLLLEFDSGDSVLLLGVKKVDETDFLTFG